MLVKIYFIRMNTNKKRSQPKYIGWERPELDPDKEIFNNSASSVRSMPEDVRKPDI